MTAAPSSFFPPERTLMGPGPSDIHPRVLAALSRPIIGHLDPEFIRMMDELRDGLRYALRTQNEMTLPISGPGSAGMECCFANLVEPGDTVVIGANGVFGERMRQNTERAGGKAVVVNHEWGRPVDPDRMAAALDDHPEARVLAFVHAETSTGAASDARALARVAHKRDCITIVDAVTSLGGSELLVDEWELDAVYSGSQKCLSCTPGLAPVTFSPRALKRVRSRRVAPHSWFLDINLLAGYWSGATRRAYHHTAPINALYALHESLVLLREEGLENAWLRHRREHEALREGLEAMGLSLLVAPEHRLPQLNAVLVPAGVNEAEVRARLLELFGLEIGAGLGELAAKIWRVGLMGYSARRRNVLYCLKALAHVLA